MSHREPLPNQSRNTNYNYISNTSQQYEQEFWKLKAQRAASTIDELKRQNANLNKKIIDMNRIEQELREKVVFLEDDWKNRSRLLTTERVSDRCSEAISEDKFTSTKELERLYKEIRIIKNTHELELSKVTEENKKLKKQIQQSSSLSSSKTHPDSLKATNKLNDQLLQLKRKTSSQQDQLSKLREEKAKIMCDNQKLKKQIQELKLKQKMAQKEEEEKLCDFKRRLEEINALKSSKRENLCDTVKEETQEEINYLPIESQRVEEHMLAFSGENQTLVNEYKQAKSQLQKQQKIITAFQKNQADLKKQVLFEQSNLQNEKLNCQIKLKKLEQDLTQSKHQLENVLKKLSPLLEKKQHQHHHHHKENGQHKAALSILDIFLKKYKIQAL